MLGLITHPDCLLHDTGPWHPECADRLHAINDRIIMSGIGSVIRYFDAPLATREQLARAHEEAYIDRMFSVSPEVGTVEIDDDTVMSAGTLKAALRAAGAGIMGVDLVMAEEANPAFCAVRPPGHHAGPAYAMGFCFFNNVAVAARHALEAHGLERVAIVDFDVHHGNGTEDIVRGDDRILMCSTFQHPFYPHTGHNSDTPNLVDVPLAAGTDGPAFRKAVVEHWLPALDAFRPQFVFVSAGFDGHVQEEMAGFALTEADYGWVTEQLVAIADTHARGRIVSCLEGGYELDALARSVVAHVKALLG